MMGDTKVPPNMLGQQTQADLELERLRDGLEVVEIAGAIKWFDASKGYGFIVPDTGTTDILLHVTCLRAASRPGSEPGHLHKPSDSRRPGDR